MAVVPRSAELSFSFYPAFSAPLRATLTVHGHSGVLCLVRPQVPGAVNDSAYVSLAELTDFFAKADTGDFLSLPSDPDWNGVDGISIDLRFRIEEKQHNLDLWSPVRFRHPGAYRILDAFFALAYAKLPAREKELEDVQMHLEYGLPVKLKSVSPTVYRMYGTLSINEQPALLRFFDSIPDTARVIFDLRNFHGMGRLLDEDFQTFDRSHPNVVWVTPGKLDDYFMDILSPARRVQTMEEAKERMRH